MTTSSFRDPMGAVIREERRIFRLVSDAQTFAKRIESPSLLALLKKGQIPKTRMISQEERRAIIGKWPSSLQLTASRFEALVEHESIFFPSYPYEWSAAMVASAGKFTVELASSLLLHGMGLKDATPYNILFKGTSPIFVDLLSFEERDRHDPIWLPYAQFVRLFLLPLLAHKKGRAPLQPIFLHKSEGLLPEELFEMTPFIGKLHRSLLPLVTIPTLLGKMRLGKMGLRVGKSLYQPKKVSNPELSTYILQRLFKKLDRHLDSAAPTPAAKSSWMAYGTCEDAPPESYSREEFIIKKKILFDWLQRCRPKQLLDVGCNKGLFSIMAAQEKISVVAIDSDPQVIDHLFRIAKKEGLDILPLVVDICRPTPAIGWNNRENLSFLERAKGAFDTVLMLALLHHMLITAQIPLTEIVKLAYELTSKNWIIEFVSTGDPMFSRLVRGREKLFCHVTTSYFEETFQPYFHMAAREQVSPFRTLYHLEKRL